MNEFFCLFVFFKREKSNQNALKLHKILSKQASWPATSLSINVRQLISFDILKDFVAHCKEHAMPVRF